MQRIDEGRFCDVGGVEQWITIRGADRRNPALLIVGGPGAAFAALAPFFADWERDFTLVQWDQPGAGFTFARHGTEAPSLAALAADGVRVAELACARLDVDKLALLSFSGGTIVGLEMIRQMPALFSAYVGSGQVVDWARQDALSYELLLERARQRGDAVMLRELGSIGPPPYRDAATDAVKSKYAGAPTPREAAEFGALLEAMAAAQQGKPDDAAYLARGLPLPDPLTRAFAAYTALRDEIVAFDARRLGRSFAVPMFFIQGAEDVYTVTAEVRAYVGELTAPHVELIEVEGAGHGASLLRREMLDLLVERVGPMLGS